MIGLELVVLLGVGAPVGLYRESLTTSMREIRTNLRGIVLLSTVLVILTAGAVAVAGHALRLPRSCPTRSTSTGPTATGRSVSRGAPAPCPEEGITWNYTTWLNIAFLLLAAGLLVRFWRTGGPAMLKMMGGSPDHSEQEHDAARMHNGHHD